MRRSFETQFTVPLAAASAIHLFTPKGEEAWVPGWRPRYVEPPDGATQAGMVFETGADSERTIWSCLEWNPDEGRASYLRVVPDTRLSRVDVACRADGPDRSIAIVRYEHTALTPSGEAWLAERDEAGFAEEIGQWHRLIEDAIASGAVAA